MTEVQYNDIYKPEALHKKLMYWSWWTLWQKEVSIKWELGRNTKKKKPPHLHNIHRLEELEQWAPPSYSPSPLQPFDSHC